MTHGQKNGQKNVNSSISTPAASSIMPDVVDTPPVNEGASSSRDSREKDTCNQSGTGDVFIAFKSKEDMVGGQNLAIFCKFDFCPADVANGLIMHNIHEAHCLLMGLEHLGVVLHDVRPPINFKECADLCFEGFLTTIWQYLCQKKSVLFPHNFRKWKDV